MRIINYPSDEAEKVIQTIETRGLDFNPKDVETVENILKDVKANGDKAVIAYTQKFDAPDLKAENLKIEKSAIDKAETIVKKEFIKSLDIAISQIDGFHEKQKTNSWISTDREGVMLGQLVQPVSSVGVYVPGGQSGKTPLVSSVLMGAIPARIAGVKKIIMVTPPTKDGQVNPHLLVAARKVGIEDIYMCGSAWAIGAMAYGTDTLPKVDVIVGPGNIYVTIAKKIVQGTVGIDIIAGPSEILIIADDSVRPAYAAADLLSQAEHDNLASAILVTDNIAVAQDIEKQVNIQLVHLTRKETAKASINNFGAIFVVDTLKQAFELSNRIAPEHLELQINDPFTHIGSIRNAGAVFLGHYTPEPMGDYIAGPNHVLPTAGTSRFSYALSVDHFIKKTSLINYSQEAFLNEAEHVIQLAQIEGLDAHANSVKIRLKPEK